MSMEDAINNHAMALRELSAAIKAMHAGRADALALPADQGGIGDVVREKVPLDTPPQKKEGVDAELEQAVSKVEDDATLTRSIPREEIEAAVAEAERKQRAADAAEMDRINKAKGDQGGAEQAPELDYAKDVRPVLLAVIKKVGKEKVAEIVKAFGVEKADQVPADKLAALLEQAQKLAA